MNLKLLTYNLHFNIAHDSAKKIIQKENPDVICFQEISTEIENLEVLCDETYELADYSHAFLSRNKFYGNAIFYNKNKLDLIYSYSNNLPRSIYELFILFLRGFNDPRTLLEASFRIKGQDEKLWIYNIHLSHMSTNQHRLNQLNTLLKQFFKNVPPEDKVVIAGDLNFPYHRRKLENLIQEYDLEEATYNIPHTFETMFLKFFHLKFKDDYIFYKNVKCKKTERLSDMTSDHYPIISEFEV